MKKLIIIISAVVLANFCQAQYQWIELTSPTTENLQTAKIEGNGDIYVFGDNAFGAKSSDDGQTWETITNIDSQFQNITTCASDVGQFYIAGENGLSKYNPSNIGWSDNPIYLSGDIEKMASDSLGNVYFFPKFIGLGSRYKIMKYEMNGNQYSTRLLYNFYLPLPKLHSMAPNFKYKSCIAGDDRIITFMHNTDNSGVLTHIFVSDDQGDSWREINFSFPAMTYVIEASFQGNVGFMTGCNMGGGGIYLYSSNDNGETWTLTGTTSDYTNVSRSIYTDFDGVNYHSITVGSKRYVGGNGFVKVDSNALTVLTPASLNYVTGDSNKIIIVGDSGKVFLGIRNSTGVNKSEGDNGDLLIFPNPSNGIFEIKSSKIMDDIRLFDISGKLLQSHAPKSQSAVLDISHLSIGVYLIQIDGLERRIIKQ